MNLTTKNISEYKNLKNAVTRTKISLLWKLWCEIVCTLEQIEDFPKKDEGLSNISEEMIKKYVRKKRGGGQLRLYYQVW